MTKRGFFVCSVCLSGATCLPVTCCIANQPTASLPVYVLFMLIQNILFLYCAKNNLNLPIKGMQQYWFMFTDIWTRNQTYTVASALTVTSMVLMQSFILFVLDRVLYIAFRRCATMVNQTKSFVSLEAKNANKKFRFRS